MIRRSMAPILSRVTSARGPRKSLHWRPVESDAGLARLIEAYHDTAAVHIAQLALTAASALKALDWLDRAVVQRDPGKDEPSGVRHTTALEEFTRWLRPTTSGR
jgi:hypothetical protein